MKVLMRERDLSDEYILFAQQIGADGLDIHNPNNGPGFAEQGYPDLEGLIKLKEKLRAAGLRIYRVAPPDPRKYLLGEPGGEEEVEHLCKTIEIFGQAGIPFMSMPVHLGINPGYRGGYAKEHRGGYAMHAFEVERMKQSLKEEPAEPFSVETHWERCVALYKQLVPVAETCNVRLITHPSDPPLPETELSPRRWAGILDAVPSDVPCIAAVWMIASQPSAAPYTAASSVMLPHTPPSAAASSATSNTTNSWSPAPTRRIDRPNMPHPPVSRIRITTLPQSPRHARPHSCPAILPHPPPHATATVARHTPGQKKGSLEKGVILLFQLD